MCYVLVSNGWLDSRSNSNIGKSACASEWHVFGIWGIGPIRGNGIAKTRAFCLRLNVNEMFFVIIKANAIRFEEDAGNRR